MSKNWEKSLRDYPVIVSIEPKKNKKLSRFTYKRLFTHGKNKETASFQILI